MLAVHFNKKYRSAFLCLALGAQLGDCLAEEPSPSTQYAPLAPEIQEASEDFAAKGQLTYVYQRKPAFQSAASLPGYNTLSPDREQSHSLTATAYLGFRPWTGGELYVNGEMALGVPLSGLQGLAAVPNGELQKASGPSPIYYLSRLFLRQTWAMGGEQKFVESGINQLAGTLDSRRVVLTAGRMSIVDIFDVTTFAHDTRNDFLNWTNIAGGAFDYAADVRGYTWGAALELYYDEWVVRGGRFAVPQESNGLQLNFNLANYHGDEVELEHNHEIGGLTGKLRLLAFRNREWMGRFDDALAYAAANGGGAPSVDNVRRANSKHGFILSFEQQLTGDIRFFSRRSWNDGQTEMYSYTEVERSTQAGIAIRGERWGRDRDTFGLAYVENGLSKQHQDYLAAGGSGFLIGDGYLNYRQERVFESYYSLALAKVAWLSFDVQRIANPAYNADRGPVNIYGVRTHLEF